MRFVASWQALTGQNPQWLSFDSEVVPYPALSRVNRCGIHFVTIRKRGVRVLRRLHALPASAWHRAVIDTTQHRPQRVRYVDETITWRGYEGPIRQLAVDGLGREQLTLFLSPEFQGSGRALIIRYTGRNRVEDALGQSINSFHLDCLASEVRLNVEPDVALTVASPNPCRNSSPNSCGYLCEEPPDRRYE